MSTLVHTIFFLIPVSYLLTFFLTSLEFISSFDKIQYFLINTFRYISMIIINSIFLWNMIYFNSKFLLFAVFYNYFICFEYTIFMDNFWYFFFDLAYPKNLILYIFFVIFHVIIKLVWYINLTIIYSKVYGFFLL